MTQLDKTPLESRDISEGRVKDFRWSPADDEIYLLLSREGHLFSGIVGEIPSRVVKDGVVAGNVQALALERFVVLVINSYHIKLAIYPQAFTLPIYFAFVICSARALALPEFEGK